MPETQPQDKKISVMSVGGLELEAAPLSRPPNSWATLDGWDRFKTGAVRKVEDAAELIERMVYTLPDGVTPDPIVAIRNYRATPESPQMIVGLSMSGQLFNLEDGSLLTSFPQVADNLGFPVVDPPFVGILAGVSGPNTVQYIVTTCAGSTLPYKWDGDTTHPPTVVGVVPASAPALVVGVSFSATAQDRGIAILVGRFYRWTYWNQTTQHESSPSPILQPTPGQYDSLISPTSTLHADPAAPYVTEIILFRGATLGPIPDDSGPIASGYTRMRVYATLDGGQEFFLASQVQGWSGHAGDGWVDIDPSDNSLPLVDPVSGFPIRYIRDGHRFQSVSPPGAGDDTQVGFAYSLATPPPYIPLELGPSPTPDPMLVQPGPTDNENDPPPAAAWGAVYQDRLWLIPEDDPSKAVFSKVGEFQSFPIDNFFFFPADEYDPVTALDTQYQQLIIGKRGSCHRIVGTDFTDFTLTPLDPQTGFLGKRALVHAEGPVFFLSRRGLMVVQQDVFNYFGRSIQPITRDIPKQLTLDNILMAVDSTRGIVIMTVFDAVGDPSFLLWSIDQPQPFSTFLPPNITGFVTAMQECEFGDATTGVVVACDNGQVHRMFAGDLVPEATAETQLLPTESPNVRRIFKRLKIAGDLTGFVYQCSVDGGPFSPEQILMRNSPIGQTGTQIAVRFIHRNNPSLPQAEVILSNFEIEFTEVGETR